MFIPWVYYVFLYNESYFRINLWKFGIMFVFGARSVSDILSDLLHASFILLIEIWSLSFVELSWWVLCLQCVV